MRPNCSWIGPEIPLSSEIFSAIKDELWLFLIPAGLALLTFGLFLEEVGFFVRHVPSTRRRQLSLWILGMYPVFALTSLVALYVPRSSSLCNFLASLYHSFTLLKFMGLITDLFGGKDRMMVVLSGQSVSPDPFPCCCCCCLPLVTVNRSSRAWMMAAVLQLSVVRSILFFVTLVLWTDEQYDYGDMDSVNPNVDLPLLCDCGDVLHQPVRPPYLQESGAQSDRRQGGGPVWKEAGGEGCADPEHGPEQGPELEPWLGRWSRGAAWQWGQFVPDRACTTGDIQIHKQHGQTRGRDQHCLRDATGEHFCYCSITE